MWFQEPAPDLPTPIPVPVEEPVHTGPITDKSRMLGPPPAPEPSLPNFEVPPSPRAFEPLSVPPEPMVHQQPQYRNEHRRARSSGFAGLMAGLAALALDGQPYSGARTYSAQGDTTITYAGRDVAGNEATPQTQAFRIDSVPPAIQADLATPGEPDPPVPAGKVIALTGEIELAVRVQPAPDRATATRAYEVYVHSLVVWSPVSPGSAVCSET